MPLLTIVIPTRNRKEVLIGSLRRLAEIEARFEAVVVDDGSTDGTPDAVESLGESLSFPLRLVRQEQRGPAAARNRALEEASGEICLFLGDDTRPLRDAVERHVRFHAEHPADTAALLGQVRWAEQPPPTEFMHWLEESGVQFGFGQIEREMRDGVVPGRFFFTSNVSAKTALLRRHGGFDERFRAAACEDTELGDRLESAGMRLFYDPDAVVEHLHPTDLPGAVRRMRTVGRARRELAERTGSGEGPNRPGGRHRIAATLLTVPAASRHPPKALRREIWRFLCHEAHREGFWSAEPGPQRSLLHGEMLLRFASRDPATRMPPPSGQRPAT